MPSAPDPRRSRRVLTLLLLLFFAPLATSFILYFALDWRPAGGSNHGELLQPLQQLPDTAKALEGRWALVYVGDGACGEDCRHALYIARQTHALLNRDTHRMNRALLATTNCCDHAFLEREHERIVVIDVSTPAARDALLARLPSGDHAHHLFVVDPLLNVVMRFDTRENPKGLLEDLKKALKLSHIG